MQACKVIKHLKCLDFENGMLKISWKWHWNLIPMWTWKINYQGELSPPFKNWVQIALFTTFNCKSTWGDQ